MFVKAPLSPILLDSCRLLLNFLLRKAVSASPVIDQGVVITTIGAFFDVAPTVNGLKIALYLTQFSLSLTNAEIPLCAQSDG